MTRTSREAKAFRRVLLRNVIFPLGLGLLSSIIFVAMVLQQVNQNQQVVRTSKVVGLTNHLQRLVIDSETGLRGFVITSNRRFLDPYQVASTAFEQEAKQLQQLVSVDAQQAARVGAIGKLYLKWRGYAEKVIEMVERQESAQAFVRQGDGKAMMDEIRMVFNEILEKEERVLIQKTQDAQSTVRTVLFLVVFLNLAFSILLAVLGRRQLLSLSKTFETNLARQLEQNEILRRDQWQKEGVAGLSETVVGEQKLANLSDGVLSYFAKFLGIKVGAFYVMNNAKKLVRTGGYGMESSDKNKMLEIGEGLVGQAAKGNTILELKASEDALQISTSLMQVKPAATTILPVVSDGNVTAVIELGFSEIPSDETRSLLLAARETIATAVKSAKYREQLETLLREVQSQAEELQAQQEELKVSNEELEEQTRMLKDAQTRLEAQAAELEQTNSQLEEQSRALEVQTQELTEKNMDLVSAKTDLETKANELQRSSQYKSEFLANMSHELRTPLNSSLILAKLLADNKDRNLNQQQVEFANQILRSGNDLLVLINDILDLAKVEAGKLELTPEDFSLRTLGSDLERTFQPLAKQKHLEFKVEFANDLPRDIRSDRLRVEQILRNLLSNAVKFTEKGSVILNVSRHSQGIAFTVIDSGIGIAKNQQEVIFEAFRQADGTTNRRYGGTGLGLAISRDLARMLGGAIEVKSEVGKGSSFSLVLPLRLKWKASDEAASKEATAKKMEKKSQEVRTFIPDDRGQIEKNDRVILIIEDDAAFAKGLRDLTHEMNFKCVITDSAAEGIDLAFELKPDAVCLDTQLADGNAAAVKDAIKQNRETRHLPVHVISKQDFSENVLKPIKREALQSAFKALEERLNQDMKSLLIVEDDPVQRQAIESLVKNEKTKIVSVGLGKDAIESLKSQAFDCVIMDLNLPDTSGFDLLEEIASLNQMPAIIVYTARDLNADEEARLKKHSQSIIVKGARSPERLLDEVTLFLHQIESQLEPSRKKGLEGMRNRDKVLEGKHVLIVDDDMRNIFALTAALEQKGAKVSMCRNGEEAVKHLADGGEPDVVLMDIMMPVMDGLEATRKIREMQNSKRLPIIALTAKAMKDDREKCFAAGANDYLSKPVDLDKLISLIRVWVTQNQELRNNGAGTVQP